MLNEKSLETFRIGFSTTGVFPHFWINYRQEYHKLLQPYLKGEDQPWPWVKKYLGHNSDFTLNHQSRRFGFGGVGSMECLGNGTVLLRINLRGRQHNRRAMLTLALIMQTLGRLQFAEDNQLISNEREQIMYLQPGARNTPKGHNVHGNISSSAIEGLRKKLTEDQLASINDRVQAAWKVVSSRGERRYAGSCGMRLAADGRPELTCFGFGITSAVTPQDDIGGWDISSDNMDGVEHGLVISAGWFALSETLWGKMYA